MTHFHLSFEYPVEKTLSISLDEIQTQVMIYLKVVTFFYEGTKRIFHHFEILSRAGLELGKS